MEITIKTPEQLIKFVSRNDVSTENAVIVCKAFFDIDGIPFSEPNTTKESILNAIEKRLQNNIKGFPMLFCSEPFENRF
jgi:hypothetical protein